MDIRPSPSRLLDEREASSHTVAGRAPTGETVRQLSTIDRPRAATVNRRRLGLLSLTAASMLSGCVATVRVPASPPPAAYVAAAPVSAAPAVAIEVQATEPPPPLPEYEQPPCPEEGWLWTPGYWAFASGGYYWVPGTWVAPPSVGVLWTPGYWEFAGGIYRFHAGYWGPHVGFYGGVNYGFGYIGTGFVGGAWVGGHFSYNTAVVNVNSTVVHNTYVNNTVINNVTVNRVSYNGPGGVQREPTPTEKAAMSEPHVPPTPMQAQHLREAASNPQLSAKANGGHPPIAATPRPAAFNASGVIGAKGATPVERQVPHAPVGQPPTPPPASVSATRAASMPHAAPPKAPINKAPLKPVHKAQEKKPERNEKP